jgi:hypothetical protein
MELTALKTLEIASRVSRAWPGLLIAEVNL